MDDKTLNDKWMSLAPHTSTQKEQNVENNLHCLINQYLLDDISAHLRTLQKKKKKERKTPPKMVLQYSVHWKQ